MVSYLYPHVHIYVCVCVLTCPTVYRGDKCVAPLLELQNLIRGQGKKEERPGPQVSVDRGRL